MGLKYKVGDSLLYFGPMPSRKYQSVEIVEIDLEDDEVPYKVKFMDGGTLWASEASLASIKMVFTGTDGTVASVPEYTGGSVSYYKVEIENPTSGGEPYTAECNDIIEALDMNYAEGNAFKAIWRRCAARTLGKAKASYKDGLYDAEKVVFFGERMVSQEKHKAGKE